MSSRPEDPEPRRDDPSAEEAAWQAIIDNYGDRATIEEEYVVGARPDPADAEPLERDAEPDLDLVDESDPDDYIDPEDEFVPPDPPPLPRTTPDRLLAWMGLLGSPAVLLLALLLRISLPIELSYLLVAAFVGGFLYLVIRMPRGPADPFDDGARL